MKYQDTHIRLALVVSLVLLVVLLASKALGHTHGTMTYDADCCSNKDCAPVTKIEYHGTYQIWHTKLFSPIKIQNSEFNGDFFSVRASQDQYHHICAFEWYGPNPDGAPGKELSTRVRCVYLPGTS